MKKIILILTLALALIGHSQGKSQKREIISTDDISIVYDKQELYIDVKNNNFIHFQIWKNKKLILNAHGSGNCNKETEHFPVSSGKYKLVIFDDQGKPKTKNFHI